jgi:hypothetical protein
MKVVTMAICSKEPQTIIRPLVRLIEMEMETELEMEEAVEEVAVEDAEEADQLPRRSS